jgi:hypothetical protein
LATSGPTANNTPLLVVWGQPPAQRLPGEGERIFNSGVLQLPAGGRRDSTSRELPRLQAYQGRDEEEEAAGNTQKYNWKEGYSLPPSQNRICPSLQRSEARLINYTRM